MVFDYYRKLSRQDRRIYNQSDTLGSVRLPTDHALNCVVTDIGQALTLADQRRVQRTTSALCQGVCEALSTTTVRVKVLAQRPSDDWGELYGLYEGREGRRRALITLWMRTAQKRQVVAFKTYLRTVLHELCHHLDYEYFQLEDSFHTEGFYRRESSLYKQLVGPPTSPKLTPVVAPVRTPIQQELF